MNGNSPKKKIIDLMLGSLIILSLGCIVTFTVYPGYLIMHWLLIGPGPAKPGVWIATRDSHSFISRAPEVNSEINADEGHRISMDFPEPPSLPVFQGKDPFFVVYGARPSNPAVIPLEWDGQCYTFTQFGESSPKSLDGQFAVVRLPLFKDKYALLPKTDLQPGTYAISLEGVAEPWDHDIGPAYYLFKVQYGFITLYDYQKRAHFSTGINVVVYESKAQLQHPRLMPLA